MYTPTRTGDEEGGIYLYGDEDTAYDPRSAYVQGSRVRGHPGQRGMVTSSRRGRPAIDDILWDDRPPHFGADSPNETAHLYLDPGARGPSIYHKKNRETFGANNKASIETIKIVVLVLLAVLVAVNIAISLRGGAPVAEIALTIKIDRPPGDQRHVLQT